MTKIKLSKRPTQKLLPVKPGKPSALRIKPAASPKSPASKKVSIGIVEDHTFIREALRNMLDAEASIRVVGEADNGRKAVETAIAERPDVMLMDIGMPRMNGLGAARQIRPSAPGVRVVLLSAFGNDSFINQTMLGDFDAYLLKDSPSNLVLHAIQEVVGGRKFFSPSISHRMRKIGAETPIGNGSRPAGKAPRPRGLDAGVGCRHPPHREKIRRLEEFSLLRPTGEFSRRAGGRSEAQRD